jgi:hypothetical protein
MNNLYTWYDVKKIMDSSFQSGIAVRPSSWKKIDIYRDEIIITVNQPIEDIQDESNRLLERLFQHHYSASTSTIRLDFNHNEITVTFEWDENQQQVQETILPLFKYGANLQEKPAPLPGVPIIAYHSYKGGVGRTLSLLSSVRSLSASPNNKKLLIVDSDLEAPGLTWMAEQQQAQYEMSFLDALSIIHETKEWKTQAVAYIADKVKEAALKIPVGGIIKEHYFLPAYRYIEQIIQLSDLPEQMVTMKDRAWIISDFLSELGKALAVDAVVLDLRAGFSEISSPFLFDPRVKKAFVTSTSLQSRKGLLSILEQVYGVVGGRNAIDEASPKILITMVPDEVDKESISKVFSSSGLSIFSPGQTENEMITLADMEATNIDFVDFSSSLVHLEGFESIDRKITSSGTGSIFEKLTEEWFPLKSEQPIKPSGAVPMDRDEFLKRMVEKTQKMQTAESSGVFEFLSTSSLKNIVQKYRLSTPSTVVLGAKGSGKTFAFTQILKAGLWEQFVQQIEHVGRKENPPATSTTYIVPIIRSENLSEPYMDMIRNQIQRVNQELGFKMDVQKITANNEIRDLITDRFPHMPNRTEWRLFWIQYFLDSTGLGFQSLPELDEYLKQRKHRVVFMVDGLEEITKNVAFSETEKHAITALCQSVISELRSIPDPNVGLILFLRRDIALNSIDQNWTQFYTSYSPYELKWSRTEALQLVMWLCQSIDPDFNDFTDLMLPAPVESMTYDLLEEKLVALWGKKLGGVSSREATSANWILSALSDLNDQLQARDIMRFLTNAAENSRHAVSTFTDRYLFPEAIRRAITPCSESKIRELEDEIPNLKPIFDKLRVPREVKQIPFNIEDYDLQKTEVRLLEQHGFLIQFEAEGYYMPEIIRLGLGFKLERGARPKVVALLNKAKSRI